MFVGEHWRRVCRAPRWYRTLGGVPVVACGKLRHFSIVFPPITAGFPTLWTCQKEARVDLSRGDIVFMSAERPPGTFRCCPRVLCVKTLVPWPCARSLFDCDIEAVFQQTCPSGLVYGAERNPFVSSRENVLVEQLSDGGTRDCASQLGGE